MKKIVLSTITLLTSLPLYAQAQTVDDKRSTQEIRETYQENLENEDQIKEVRENRKSSSILQGLVINTANNERGQRTYERVKNLAAIWKSKIKTRSWVPPPNKSFQVIQKLSF